MREIVNLPARPHHPDEVAAEPVLSHTDHQTARVGDDRGPARGEDVDAAVTASAAAPRSPRVGQGLHRHALNRNAHVAGGWRRHQPQRDERTLDEQRHEDGNDCERDEPPGRHPKRMGTRGRVSVIHERIMDVHGGSLVGLLDGATHEWCHWDQAHTMPYGAGAQFRQSADSF